MRIVVFGAAGRTGRLVVGNALGHGHEVTAFIHHSNLDLESPRLTKYPGNVLEIDSVRPAMRGAEAVIYALSSNDGSGIHEPGISNVIYAMAENGVAKLSALSAAGAFDRSSHMLSLGFRMHIATTLRRTYDDLEAMERRIAATDFAWTIVRPYGLADTPAEGHYRLTLDGSLMPKAGRISRADVAGLLLKAVEVDSYYRRTLVIAGAEHQR